MENGDILLQDEVDQIVDTNTKPERELIPGTSTLEILNKLRSGELIQLKAKSGLGETLQLGLITTEPSEEYKKRFESINGCVPKEAVSFVVLATGNGIVFNEGELGLVSYRDLLIVGDDNDADAAYTDYRADSYDPTGHKVDRDSLPARFLNIRGGSNSIQRIQLNDNNVAELTEIMKARGMEGEAKEIQKAYDEGGDPYKRGLATLMQAAAVVYLEDRNITSIKRGIHLNTEANKLWTDYGVTVDKDNNGKLDLDTVSNAKKILEDSIA